METVQGIRGSNLLNLDSVSLTWPAVLFVVPAQFPSVKFNHVQMSL